MLIIWNWLMCRSNMEGKRRVKLCACFEAVFPHKSEHREASRPPDKIPGTGSKLRPVWASASRIWVQVGPGRFGHIWPTSVGVGPISVKPWPNMVDVCRGCPEIAPAMPHRVLLGVARAGRLAPRPLPARVDPQPVVHTLWYRPDGRIWRLYVAYAPLGLESH